MSPEQPLEPLGSLREHTFESASKGKRMNASASPIHVGIDIAKDKLDLARSDRPTPATFSNDARGHAAIVRALGRLGDALALIVVEATGGYEQRLVWALLDADLPVAVVNPARVRHLASAKGRLAKTDAIDARILVDFARDIQPRMAEKRDKNQLELQAMVTYRRQLLHDLDQQRNRLETVASPTIRSDINEMIQVIQQKIERVEKQTRELIESDDELSQDNRIIQSIPGVGPVLGATVLASLREAGHIGARQIAALTGVAPINRDSGKRSGKRQTAGGRADVRCVLYMATLSAIQHNPLIRALYLRLRDAGKLKMVAVVACMRKLLTYINAVLRDRITWDQLNQVKALKNT